MKGNAFVLSLLLLSAGTMGAMETVNKVDENCLSRGSWGIKSFLNGAHNVVANTVVNAKNRLAYAWKNKLAFSNFKNLPSWDSCKNNIVGYGKFIAQPKVILGIAAGGAAGLFTRYAAIKLWEKYKANKVSPESENNDGSDGIVVVETRKFK